MREEIDMCNCGPEVKIQEYQNTVTVDIPPHMKFYRAARETVGLSATVSIDRCILPEIESLWALGIHTHGSCCGHNAKPSMVNVRESDDARMVEMGYIRWENIPKGCCRQTFHLKTIPMAAGAPVLPVEAGAAVPAREALAALSEVRIMANECIEAVGVEATISASWVRAMMDETLALLGAGGDRG